MLYSLRVIQPSWLIFYGISTNRTYMHTIYDGCLILLPVSVRVIADCHINFINPSVFPRACLFVMLLRLCPIPTRTRTENSFPPLLKMGALGVAVIGCDEHPPQPLWDAEIATKTVIKIGLVNRLRAARAPTSTGRTCMCLRRCRTTPCFRDSDTTYVVPPPNQDVRCCHSLLESSDCLSSITPSRFPRGLT